MATRKPRKRSITAKESLKFLKEFFEDHPIVQARLQNHKKTYRTADTYQITVDKFSLTWYNALLSEEWVKDVYYNPIVPPTGMGYGISLRYQIYIKYNKIAPTKK